jgi:hypothetical protein
MKRVWLVMATGLLAALVAASSGAQSVADAAKAARKNRKSVPDAKKVYTNDDLPTSGNISVLGPEPAPPPTAEAAGEKAGTDKPAGEKAAPSDASKPAGESSADESAKAEQEWRGRFAEQRKNIAQLERELDVAKREQNVKLTAYYADVGNQLRDSKNWNEETAKLRNEIASKEKDLAAAKDKLEAMREELRHAGLPSSIAE